MSNLDDRYDAPRYPVGSRAAPVNEAVAAAFIIGVLCGLMVLTVVVSIFVYADGGHLCFSHDGASCVREGMRP